ncbi:MAG: hypothetical protein C0410_10400 [Anaerolinea sp.]|nr:hypothetical protein [Anaerolinea sp.]
MTEVLESPAVYLEWDSTFFQKRIGRVNSRNMTDHYTDSVDVWAYDNQIDCVYYLANGLEIASAKAAEFHHFHLMDLRVTYNIDLRQTEEEPSKDSNIRPALQNEIAELKRMAGEFHENSRFFVDDHFERSKCRELYELWIERDFKEANRFLWVCEEQGQIAGYTSATIDLREKTAHIGLVGVNPQYRGQGIGLNLQMEVLSQLRNLGVNNVEVVTQGRNIRAQNLYQKSGYRLKSIDLWYHKWYTNP